MKVDIVFRGTTYKVDSPSVETSGQLAQAIITAVDTPLSANALMLSGSDIRTQEPLHPCLAPEQSLRDAGAQVPDSVASRGAAVLYK